MKSKKIMFNQKILNIRIHLLKISKCAGDGMINHLNKNYCFLIV